MTIETWQVETLAAERYERVLVPALMAAWAARIIEAAGVQQGDRVLDVACGTGIVARTAVERAGATGHVVGLDLNPGMLAVAARLDADIEWRQGDATALPYADHSFDRVLCQFALMFFPDRLAALREMRRVLRPGGRLAIATWDTIESSPPYARQAAIVGRLAGADAEAIVRAPFVLADPVEIRQLVEGAGFIDIEITTIPDGVVYPGIDAILEGEFEATPLGAYLRERDPAIHASVLTAMREALRDFETNGKVVFPVSAHIAAATAP